MGLKFFSKVDWLVITVNHQLLIENVQDLIDDLQQAFENTLNNKDLSYCI